jgi:hypothetical protein
MHAYEDTGIEVTEVGDPGELPVVGAGPRPPHVVRVRSTASDGQDWQGWQNWQDCGDLGLVVRPAWVHWVLPAGDGADGMLAGQTRQQRSRTRRAARTLADLAGEVHEPVGAAVFAEWSRLYAAQVHGMKYGRNLAAIFRKDLLAPDSGALLLGWRHAGRLVCGCVAEVDAERSALVMRFSAVAPEARAGELPRGMYAALADLAAERGLRWVTAGNDVNFYGAMLRPGLCAFKLRLGFRPVPGDLFGKVAERTVAERVTSLAGLEAPVLRFGYRRPRPPAAVVDDFVAGPDRLGLVSVAPPGPADQVLGSLPEHRRLVLAA